MTATQETALRVVAEANSGAPTQTTLIAASLGGRARAKRAAKVGGVFFLCALGFLPVPMLHFIFVPLFLLISIVSSALVFAQREMIEGGAIVCPCCGASFDVGRVRPRFPIKSHCPSCRNDVRLRVLSA